MAKIKKGKELTGVQTVQYVRSDAELRRLVTTTTYAAYRKLSKDPTVALGKGLLVSGILSGSWSVEADEGVPEDRIDFIKNLMIPMRESIMRNAVSFGRVDFGWQGYEKVFGVDKDGKITLTKLKPLLQDITIILIDKHGSIAGYKQRNVLTALPITIPLEKILHIAFDVEGANHYGHPLLENIRETQISWDNCDAGAKRYDSKLAGSHFVVHYPPGTSTVDGETVDNSEIACRLLNALESSGSMAIPSTTAEYVQELNDLDVAKLYQWDVKILSDTNGKQPTFLKRLQYLDKLKIRGLVLPERSMLEGEHGTLAEAGAHIGLAITHMQEIDQQITREVNAQVVDQILALNYGDDTEGTVRLVAAPLVDTEIGFKQKLYLELVESDKGTIDTSSLKDALNIPSQEMEEMAEPVVEEVVEDGV